MPITPVDKNIDGADYKVQPFGGVKGVAILAEIAKTIGVSVATLATAGTSQPKPKTDKDGKPIVVALTPEQEKEKEQRESEAIAKAAQMLFDRMDSDRVADLVVRLLSNTHRDGKFLGDKDVLNRTFAANYGEMLKALYFVLEVNYSKLFTGGQATISKLMRVMGQEGPTSTDTAPQESSTPN